MAYLLGWKDVLRPIRDGYRHLFPSPDTGPTPEERRKQRAIDQLKGFAYFDTFEQLEAWTQADADPLQRANTPLLRRSVNEQEQIAKTNILLCHDYAGNYHDYEGALSVGVEDEEKYACEYLQHVDTFVYFSHKLVCIPPPTWTNTLHRNGVKALGTILLEPQTRDPERLFRHSDDALSFCLATKLARIAEYFGFDGWLVNIEKPFAAASWDEQLLTAFLRQLRSDLGVGKQLIWYDALTTSNKVSYQNALNAENSSFAKACGGILTNYCWKEKDAKDSMHESLLKSIPPRHIYFGIDVWAQNVTKLSQPRVTYPEYGGGGTNTGVAVAKLAELGLSAGIFAPAWTFEHFPGHGRVLEQTVWDGRELPKDVACSCGDCEKRHQPNRVSPVAMFARSANAGSETFFFTDFSRAFHTIGDEEKECLFRGCTLRSQLGSQSILPFSTEYLGTQRSVRYKVEDVKTGSQLVIETCCQPLTFRGENKGFATRSQSIPLFRFNMPADGSLRLRISYRDLSASPMGTGFYLNISGTTYKLAQPNDLGINHLLDVEVRASDTCALTDPRLEEIGYYSQATNATTGTRLAEIDYICIQPVAIRSSQPQVVPHCEETLLSISSPAFFLNGSRQCHTIFNVHQESRSEGEAKFTRLHWNHASNVQPAQGMPYSAITGPFSYFAIYLDGIFFGRAYAAEHEVPTSFVERSAGREVVVAIRGVGFDGQELACASMKIQF